MFRRRLNARADEIVTHARVYATFVRARLRRGALLYAFPKIRSSADLTSSGAAAKLSNTLLPKSEAKQTMNRRFVTSFALALLLAAACACATTQNPANTSANASPSPTAQAANVPAELRPALDSITSDDILKHIKTLSSDEFEGRGPGTRGEELSVGYITEQFKRIGLKPGNPDGTYVQKVPLMGFQAEPQFSIKVGDRALSYNFPDDYVAVSRHDDDPDQPGGDASRGDAHGAGRQLPRGTQARARLHHVR